MTIYYIYVQSENNIICMLSYTYLFPLCSGNVSLAQSILFKTSQVVGYVLERYLYIATTNLITF